MSEKKNSTRDQDAGFSEAERKAMKERAQELKSEARKSSGGKKAKGLDDLLEKVAEMPEEERDLATRLHEIIMESGPELSPKTWYGMPAYALDGKVVCFFQGASKFGARYATLGFNDTAKLDDGAMWPTSFALVELTADVEKRIGELVKKAVG